MDSKSFSTYKTKSENNQNGPSYLIENNESQAEEKTIKDMFHKDLNKRAIEVVCNYIFFKKFNKVIYNYLT